MHEGTKKILRAVGLGANVDRVEHGFCATCGKPVSADEFRDELSRKEHKISGMCQVCQDSVFNKGR